MSYWPHVEHEGKLYGVYSKFWGPSGIMECERVAKGELNCTKVNVHLAGPTAAARSQETEPRPSTPDRPPVPAVPSRRSVAFNGGEAVEITTKVLREWIGLRVIVVRKDGAGAEGTLKAVYKNRLTVTTSASDWSGDFSDLLSAELAP